MSSRTHWIMDYETMSTCFVAVFQHYNNPSIQRVFAVSELQTDYKEFIKFLNECVSKKEWHISFNGLNFDAQITQEILKKQHLLNNMTSKQQISFIYNFAQEVITKSSKNEFLPYPPFKLAIKQIDLFKLNHWDNKAKMSSLKWIQYSMDWENVEEMPMKHNDPVKDIDDLNKVITYCINDVKSTAQIFNHSKEQIALRQTLTKEYNIDLYSASEPRISKELFLHFLEQKTGIPKADLKTLRTPRDYIVLADCILPYIKFETPEFNSVLNYFRTKVITSTKDGFKYSINFKGVKTDYGLGGIHGATSSGLYEAKEGWTIMTSDVTSFYPNLAIKNYFHPEHLPQKGFGELYEWFFEERKKIPKTDPKNYVYKIILNSTYGLTGDENSFLYDPKMTMQITINGQLLLSKLAEMLSLAIPECQPLMLNTDGLEMMIPDCRVKEYMKVCTEWEKLTKLSLEHDQYSKMIIRDVNNYMAVSKEGKVKSKGAFEWEDLDKKKVSTFHKNKSFLIIPKAIYAYFVNNIEPEEFLEQNNNIFDYCAGVKAKGGWYFEERNVVNGELKIKKLQKIIRYYISTTGSKLIKCNPDGREIQAESGEWLQTTVNKIDKTKTFESYNINKKYYLEEIYKQIEQIQKVTSKSMVQLSLF